MQRSVIIALCLAAIAGAALGQAAPPTFASDGPCGSKAQSGRNVRMPTSTGCKGRLDCTVRVYVTTPAPSSPGANGCPASPWPVVYLFNGFGARAALYSYLAKRLASWGFVVVQYDATMTNDATELHYLPYIKADVATAFGSVADASRQATAGHSRGGKLAALHLAQNPTAFATAVLIDPVDNTVFSPEGPLYPNAAKALAALSPHATAAVLGAGVTSLCNPADANYATFYAQLGAGSWQALLPGATHADFIGPIGGSSLVPSILPVCGTGTAPAASAQAAAAATAAAWLQKAFYAADTSGYAAWAAAQQGSSAVQLAVKA